MRIIQVHTCKAEGGWLEFAFLLEGLVPVRFCFGSHGVEDAVGDLYVGELGPRQAGGGDASDRPSLSVPSCEAYLGQRLPIEIAIRFADDPDVPFPFRSRALRAKVAMEPEIIRLTGSEKILASCERGPVWVVSATPGPKRFKSGFALPGIAPAASLKSVLHEGRFLELLPVIHWLRELGAAEGYSAPPLRACFMFDDPNLHWPRYGHVDYRQVAAQAAKVNYHVAFAMIPLDTWFTHGPTAELFRGNVRRLSLLVHGNNHTKKELARRCSKEARARLLRQAVGRVEQFERRAGLRVCRVMVPPHGACSEEMLADLPRFGFEAACISHGSLAAHNKTKAWTRSLGYLPSEQIQGCSVLPRWGITGDTSNVILLAAFLGQPIILRGHSQDLRNGIELLDHWAAFINGLGSVTWSNMTGVCRSNYLWRAEGEYLRIRPLARRFTVDLPRTAKWLLLDVPSHTHWGRWHMVLEGIGSVQVYPGQPLSLFPQQEGIVSVELVAESLESTANVPQGGAAWALVRRLLTEGRDRVLR
jgi:hypothetical protein